MPRCVQRIDRAAAKFERFTTIEQRDGVDGPIVILATVRPSGNGPSNDHSPKKSRYPPGRIDIELVGFRTVDRDLGELIVVADMIPV